MRSAARCSAPSANCRSTTRRAPSARSSANIARPSPIPSDAASSSWIWARATAARRSRGCRSWRRRATSRSTSRATRSRSRSRTMAPEFPEIEMLGIVADFTDGLDLEADLDARAVTFFYPGSSIGNFDPDAALAFLRRVQASLRTAAGQWPADRRRHQEGQGAARRRLRRCGRRDRRLQPQRAASREPSARQRFPAGSLCASRLLQCRRRPGGDASRGDDAANGTAAGRRAQVRGRRTHPHREFLQVRAVRVQPDARRGADSPTSPAGRTPAATSRCSTPPDRARGARPRTASARPAERNCDTWRGGARRASRSCRRAARTART